MCKLFFLAALLTFTEAAFAQGAPRVELFSGYSYANARFGGGRANASGWNSSTTVNLFRWFGVEADFGGLYGASTKTTIPVTTCPTPPCQPASISFTGYIHTFLAGPRFSYRREKMTIFAHELLGGGILSGTTVFSNFVLPPGVPSRFSSSVSSFALAAGGGADYAFHRNLAWRVQADYVQTRFSGARQDDFRASTGIVVRFGR